MQEIIMYLLAYAGLIFLGLAIIESIVMIIDIFCDNIRDINEVYTNTGIVVIFTTVGVILFILGTLGGM